MPFSAGKLHLLIVEDNPGDFLLIEDYLREEIASPVIQHATTFSQAKEKLKHNIDFDAVLLDLSLPDASGEQLVNEIVQLSGLTPVIVLTGYADKDFGIKTLSLGISDYLLKDDLTSSQLYKSIIYSIERRRNNLQLKESEEKHRNLFNFSPLPMWVCDIETFRFLNVNEAAIRHYGYSREEFLAMTKKDIRPKEDAKNLEDIVSHSKKTGDFYRGVSRHIKKNGELIHVDIQSSEIDFNGRKARLILATDITESINHLNAIEEQNAKLREIAWMQSHVVRAPLARMMGLINLLTIYPTEKTDITQVLHYIMASARDLDDIIKQIVEKTEEVEKKSG